MSKTKCSIKIWNKFSRNEKIKWNKLYKLLYSELSELSKYGGKEPVFSGNAEVVAHNLTCILIWKEGKENG
jgi:hypothetical protein